MEKFLRHKILNGGPITVAEFMKLALTGKNGGYYMEKDVFGRQGDFITAPELCQLFGESIALNFVNKLQLISRQFYKENDLHLIEFGPGRGTLMADVLRTFQVFPSIWDRLKKCSLIEVSPHLKHLQKEKLLGQFPQVQFEWLEDVQQLQPAKDSALLFVAQEFFDALPVHVFKRSERDLTNHLGWKELLVSIDSSGKFSLIEAETKNIERLCLNTNFPDWPAGKTLELSPESWRIAHLIRQLLRETAAWGEGIIIDYGRFGPSQHSLRAIYRHRFCPLFEHLGEADLSVDVDFQSLMHYLGQENEYRFSTQGQFLSSMGISQRLEHLKQSQPKSTADLLESSVNRLISKHEMGTIYKVLQFSKKAATTANS